MLVRYTGPLLDKTEVLSLARDLTPDGLPVDLVLGLLFAEGGGTQITERWGELAWRAMDLVAVGERDGWDTESAAVGPLLTARRELQDVVDRVRASPNPADFSWGPAHLSYQVIPGNDSTYSLPNIMVCRAWALDPHNSLPLMLEKLGRYWRTTGEYLPSLYLYNSPGNGGRPASYRGDGGAMIVRNYTAGLASGRAWLAAH